MRQIEPFRHSQAVCRTSVQTAAISVALELGLAAFIGLSALHLYQLLAIAAP